MSGCYGYAYRKYADVIMEIELIEDLKCLKIIENSTIIDLKI